ncbi:hypothetical protein FSP39_020665 [Pinctada imbricata]|uniref:Uncharacterized protein n=1 Tax=Pinctada imbricata TaxID=66713 RepID=A0AA88YCI3_PINIB|nr:hypothetical protein FSP39_020665 [Pinctada imbricata]
MDPVKHQETQLNKYKITYQKIPQDLESRNYNGQTCLHVAAEGTHLPCIRLLVKKGANSNAADGKSGRTALHYAAESGNRILLEFLLQNPKVSVHAKTYAGLTPIMLAVGRGFGDIVMRLRQSGAIIESIAGEESESDEDMLSPQCVPYTCSIYSASSLRVGPAPEESRASPRQQLDIEMQRSKYVSKDLSVPNVNVGLTGTFYMLYTIMAVVQGLYSFI